MATISQVQYVAFVSPSPVTRGILIGLLLAFVSDARAGQGTDPRADFIEALGQFSLSLDGTYGDEGRRLRAGVDAMSDALTRWDMLVQASERSMARDLGTANPALAARMHLALGTVYLDRRRVSDAIRELSAARASDPSRADAPWLLGLAQLQLTGNRAAAIDALRASSDLDPQNPIRTYQLARARVEAGGGPETTDLAERLAGIGRDASRPSDAARLLARLDLVPDRPGVEPFLPPVAYAKGFASLRAGNLARAVEELRESVQHDPLAGVTDDDLLLRAASAFRDGLVDQARSVAKTVLAQSPARAEAHRLLGMLDLADGDADAAVTSLTTAAGLAPADERTRLGLARALQDAGHPDSAERVLVELARDLPASGRAHYQLGLAYQREGKRAEAVAEMQTVLTLGPVLGTNTVHRMLASLHEEAQDFGAAAASLSARVELIPGDASAHTELGRVLTRLGDLVQARAELDVALLLDPSDVEAHTLLAQLHLREGRYGEAAEQSRLALQIDANHREARYVHATSLIRLGRTDDGNAEMRIFQQLQAEDGRLQERAFELGRLRREASVSRDRGDSATAVALLQKALVLDPTSPVSHLDLGLALMDARQYAAAADRLNTAAALGAPIVVHRHLADAYAALGQTEQSRQEHERYEQLKRDELRRTGEAR